MKIEIIAFFLLAILAVHIIGSALLKKGGLRGQNGHYRDEIDDDNPFLSESEMEAKVVDLLRRRQKIEAIKFVRVQRNIDLKRAKETVEAIEAAI